MGTEGAGLGVLAGRVLAGALGFLVAAVLLGSSLRGGVSFVAPWLGEWGLREALSSAGFLVAGAALILGLAAALVVLAAVEALAEVELLVEAFA
ncbi:MAG: hypothetical protein K6T35_04015 [Meiothermus silvanus]|uniref:hypothetical protein n=1 Tax=Allomeiothermus silvanus TaxID=52022 RepID=UPI00019EA4E7|nr:hypothetical protein [Allomeiothermus silvanus]MBI5812114.1 hypothetical protein [Allomeiothermus silvanus]MCL6568046.1 hypothetical protein [Allomeiothermus silvanus]